MAKFDKKASKKGQSKKTKDAQAIQAASEVKVRANDTNVKEMKLT